MTFLALLFLLTAHYFAGSGLLHLFRIRLGTAKHGAISVISGIVLHSLIPMLLEMAHIPLTLMSVATGVVGEAVFKT